MKLVKSLLLGSAAGLFAVAGAQAADLPVRKAAPVVDYVRVCSAYGAGFFFIPGTETCLRVSGRVRAEYAIRNTEFRSDDFTSFRARGQLNLDARTQTAYGTLRTFIRVEVNRNVGPVYGAAANLGGTGAGGGGVDTGNAILNKAFIQFAGITAGRTTSFFDFYANGLNWGGSFGSDTYGVDPVVLAYTASFGSGFSATISLEDQSARRGGLGGFSTAFIGGIPGGLVFEGSRLPTIVGQLRVDQAWGSAQLSAALHNENVAPFTIPVGFLGAGTVVNPDSDYGFAIQGGVKINLPMIAAGDQLWLQAAYATGAGALSFLGNPPTGLGRVGLGGITNLVVDTTGRVRESEGFNLTAAFLHY